MFNIIVAVVTFTFIEVVIYATLIFNQNIHIKKELDNTLNRDYSEFLVINDFFYDDVNTKIYNKFNSVIILKDISSIDSYENYLKQLESVTLLFQKQKNFDYLKSEKIFYKLKEKRKYIELFEDKELVISYSFIPFTEAKNLNFYIKLNDQSQIFDIKLRTNFLFLVISFLIVILLSYMFIVSRIKSKLSQKNIEHEKLLDIIDKHILITETDTEGFITNISTAFSNITGYSKSELIGRSHNIIRHPDTPKELFESMWKCLRSGNIWKGKIKNIDRNGNDYWVYGTIVPKFDINHNIVGYISFRRDITDKKRVETLNNDLKKQIESKIDEMEVLDSNLIQQSKMALVGNMVDIIAHQWKQPLSVMSLYAIDISESVKYEEMTQSYADDLSNKFKKQITHLANTLNEFRTFFSPNKMYDKFNLSENIENTLLLVNDELINNKIDVEVIGDKNITIFGVSNEFQHIFLNFISNSRDAFNENNIDKREIKIRFLENEDRVEIDYFDNAGGIKENILHKIFDLNFTTKPIGVGSGVGMYASKLIVSKLGGEISVQNCDAGVNFKIVLSNKDRRTN